MFSRQFSIKHTNFRGQTTIIKGPNLFGPKSSSHVPKKPLPLKLKEGEIIGGKKESYFRRVFGTLHRKRKISKIFYTFFVWSMKSVQRVSRTISVEWKQSSSTEKEH